MNIDTCKHQTPNGIGCGECDDETPTMPTASVVVDSAQHRSPGAMFQSASSKVFGVCLGDDTSKHQWVRRRFATRHAELVDLDASLLNASTGDLNERYTAIHGTPMFDADAQ